MHELCVPFGFVALGFAVLGCSAAGADSSGNGDSNLACVAGEAVTCACPDGTTGVQSCNAEGTYDACPCGGDWSTGGAGGASPGAGGGDVGDGGSGSVTATGGITGSGGTLGSGGVVGTGGGVATGGLGGAGGAIGTGGLAGSGGGMTIGDCLAPPAGTPASAVEAWTVLNEIRVATGAGCMNSVPELVTSAQNHCDYIALNANNSSCVPDGHTEVQGCPGFTGRTAGEREIAAGYPAALAYTEVKLTYGNNPSAAIPNWLATPFHRIPLLDPWTSDMGYGGAADCDVIDIGRGVSSMPADAIAMYPFSEQTDVPAAWNGYESPQPPAPAGGFPSSYPISIYARGMSITEHLLTKDGDSTPLEHVWLDTQSPLVSGGLRPYFTNTAVLYGAPFELDTTYRVRILGTYTGGPLNVEWTFTSGSTRPWGT